MVESDHYVDFHSDAPPDARGPLIVVHGNCQAESVRIVIDGPDVHTVRIPPAHELTGADLPHLARLLARTTLLVSQPIRDDYHDLPLGTHQLAAMMPPGSSTVLFPVIRFAGLYPFHLIVRPPSDPSLTPPLVAYHDARLLRTAHDRLSNQRATVRRVDVSTEQVREVGRRSIAELRAREMSHSTVPVSDLFEHPSFDQMRTMNHPGNAIWSTVARRIRETVGLSEAVTDPGRPLLTSIHAPRLEVVAEAYGLADDAVDHWVVEDREVSCAEVEEAHLRWYAEHPDAVEAGLARHAETLAVLGLG